MRITAKLLIILITIVMLTACGGAEKEDVFTLPPEREEGTQVELTVWETYTKEESLIFQQIIEMFEERHKDIKIKREKITYAGHWSSITKALATKETPDISRVDFKHIATLADRGAILDLKYLEASKITSSYIDAAINSNISGNSIWGIPDQVNTVVLYYNKKLLNNLGVNLPNASWTWDTLLEAHNKVSNQNPNIKGLFLDDDLIEHLPLLLSNGAKLLNDSNTKLTLDSNEAIKTLELWLNIKKDVENHTPSALEGFLTGQYAMILAGPENIKEVKEAGIDYGIAPIPKGTAGSKSYVNGTSMVIFKDSQHPREAYEFITFLTSPEIQTLWTSELGQIPVNKEVFNSIDQTKNQQLKVLIEQTKTAQPRPFLVNYNQINEIYTQNLQQILAGEKTIEQALKDTTNEVNNNPKILQQK